MALDLRQSLKLSQQLLMTPQLQQAIKLLQLSRIELEQFVSQQLAENPILEEASESQDNAEKDSVERTSDDVMQDQLSSVSSIVDDVAEGEKKEIDWEALSRVQEASSQPASANKKSHDDEHPNYENLSSNRKSLTEHLMTQIGESELDQDEKNLAAILIGNLSEKGYLDLDWDEFCKEQDIDVDYAEGVLDTLQRLHPPGIAARSLQECLLIQIREHHLKNGVVEKVVSQHMKELEIRNYAVIAKSMKISLDEVVKNAATIAELDPIPAREFGGDPTYHVIPDVYVFKMSGKWVVSLNDEGLPNLRINSFYKEIAQDRANGKDKEYVQEKLKSAQWLIKSIQQRQKTIFKVTECIVEKQKDFFEKGVQFLKPMVLRDIAEDIGMHESTISRVTTSKYVHTPRGIFELKYFFNSSVARAGGGDVASESVKVMIKGIVDSESPQKPYSDQKIVAILEEKGVRLARRTVAKYREQLGILPSSKRKKYF
ncbi:MAG: RNA polymerase factor sigma-54 [Oligoflexales bacterium]|nr:RNA polymerase factor sigma-54 [Oligoflexales bacterium]